MAFNVPPFSLQLPDSGIAGNSEPRNIRSEPTRRIARTVAIISPPLYLRLRDAGHAALQTTRI